MNELIKVNNEGKVTARELYRFLGLRDGDFSRWIKNNIESNNFAEEGHDYLRLRINAETPTGGKIERLDYELSLDFAKKLCMVSKSERGEQARNYFIEVEKRYKSTVPTMTITEIVAHNAMQLLKQEQAIKETRQEVAAIREVVVVRPDRVREWVDKVVSRIVAASGGDYARIRAESYQLLNRRMGVNVYTRKANREAKVGHKIPTIDIVLSDKKLKEGYVAILKELAIHYGVADIA